MTFTKIFNTLFIPHITTKCLYIIHDAQLRIHRKFPRRRRGLAREFRAEVCPALIINVRNDKGINSARGLSPADTIITSLSKCSHSLSAGEALKSPNAAYNRKNSSATSVTRSWREDQRGSRNK